jgi:chitodextrinase
VEAYSGADLTATITGLTPKTAYAFTVTALNAVGESAQSAAVNITTKSNTRPSRISLGIRLGL